LDTFNGQRWTSSSRFTPVGLGLPSLPGTGPTRTVTAHFRIRQLDGSLVPTASWPVVIRGSQLSADPGTGMLVSDAPLRRGMSYSLVSDVSFGLQPSMLAGLPAARGPGSDHDLKLTPGIRTAVHGLADSAMKTGVAASAFQRAVLLERYLRDGFSND